MTPRGATSFGVALGFIIGVLAWGVGYSTSLLVFILTAVVSILVLVRRVMQENSLERPVGWLWLGLIIGFDLLFLVQTIMRFAP